MTLRTLYPIYCSNSGVGHICLSLCHAMQDSDFEVRLTVPSTEPADRRDFVLDAVPHALRTLSCRKPLRKARRWCTERRYVHQFEQGDVAYIWPGSSIRVFEELKSRGCTIIMERINCHRQTARRILDDAYDRLGWPPAHGITAEQTASEQYKLSLADYVFCPSPLVRDSMLDAGVSAGKLLSTSYGWDPRRFVDTKPLFEPIDGITAVFVGLACIRKGIHLLLNAWARSGVKGRLVIAGDLEPDVARRCAQQLKRPDIVHVPHCSNVAGAYRSADLFIFPTLEEGSPLVSYEAMACGLPVVTSPMGAGEIVRNGVEGLVLDPYDAEAWVSALQRLAVDTEYRKNLGENARLRAADFTWADVGRRRRSLLKSKLQSAGVICSESVAVAVHP